MLFSASYTEEVYINLCEHGAVWHWSWSNKTFIFYNIHAKNPKYIAVRISKLQPFIEEKELTCRMKPKLQKTNATRYELSFEFLPNLAVAFFF